MSFNKEIESIYAEYYPLVYSTLYLNLKDREKAKDLAQEVFILLFQKIEKVENCRSWLYTTTKNLLKNYCSKKEHTEIDLEGEHLTCLNAFYDLKLILNECVEKAVTNAADHFIYNMIAVSGLSYADTARALNLKTHAVKYRYQQILKVILLELNKKGIKRFEDLL